MMVSVRPMHLFTVCFCLVTDSFVHCVVCFNFYCFPVGHLSTARVSVIVSFHSVAVFVSPPFCVTVVHTLS